MRPRNGQALVELALALPFLLFLILGTVEVGMIVIAKADQDRKVWTVAEYAAQRPGEDWHTVANRVGLGSCDVTVEDDPGKALKVAGATCWYQPIATRGLFDGIPISSTATAVVRDAEPDPTPEPSGSVAP